MKILPLGPRIFLRTALLTLACVLFALFLLVPSFVDSVKGDGAQTMRPGWTQVFWDIWFFLHIWELDKTEFFYILFVSIPSLLAEIGILLLPLLHCKKFFGHSWLRFGMAGIFSAGGTAFGWLVWHESSVNYGTGYGVWLWLLAVMFAALYCLLKSADSQKNENV
jgi:hypothetical protein